MLYANLCPTNFLGRVHRTLNSWECLGLGWIGLAALPGQAGQGKLGWLIRALAPHERGHTERGGEKGGRAPETKVPPPLKLEEKMEFGAEACATPKWRRREKSGPPLPFQP